MKKYLVRFFCKGDETCSEQLEYDTLPPIAARGDYVFPENCRDRDMLDMKVISVHFNYPTEDDDFFMIDYTYEPIYVDEGLAALD